MKTISNFIGLCLFSLLFSCKPDDTMDIPFPSCMIAKINQYQLKNQKLKLVEIDQDGTKYYWLKNESLADEIENVYDASCNFFCFTDCECEPTGDHCDSALFNWPKKVVWESK